MNHPLDGVREKMKRANEHLDRLEADTRTYLTSKPYRFSGEREGSYYVIKLRVLRETPLALAVTLGDVLYQLRSALDHLAFSLALLERKPPKGTEFPIFIDKPEFLRTTRGGGMWKARGIRADRRAIVQQLQPYKAGRDKLTHPLWVLHELTNADKHRTLNFGGGIAEELGFEFEYDDLTLGEPELIPGPFVDGAIVARVFAVQTGPHPRMQVKPHATFNVTYDEGGLFGGGKLPSLLELRDATANVVERFGSEFP